MRSSPSSKAMAAVTEVAASGELDGPNPLATAASRLEVLSFVLAVARGGDDERSTLRETGSSPVLSQDSGGLRGRCRLVEPKAVRSRIDESHRSASARTRFDAWVEERVAPRVELSMDSAEIANYDEHCRPRCSIIVVGRQMELQPVAGELQVDRPVAFALLPVQ